MDVRSLHRVPAATLALASLSLTMLLSSLGTSIANVGLPAMALAFNASIQDVQWIVLAYLLAITSLVVGAGRLGDLTGRRRLMLAGLFVFTLASALCGFAPSLRLLVAARAVQGMGAAIMMTLTMSFVGETVPSEKTGSAMGLLGTMSALGTALGPGLGGILIAGPGWRAIFFILLPLGATALALAWRFLPADRPAPAAERALFDYPGMLLLALTLAAYALAMTTGKGRFGWLNAWLGFAAAAGVGLFVLVESRAASPLIRLAMFRIPAMGGGFVMSMLVTTVVMATLVVGPFYLSGALALDAAHAGLAMSAGPLIAALTGVPGGRLVDRFGAHGMTIAALTGMAAGSVLLSMMPASAGISGYIAPLVLITAGYALFQAANNTAVMADVPAGLRGVSAGLLNLSRNLGLVTGASMMGAVFAHASSSAGVSVATAEAVTAGTHVTFAVAAVLVLAALIIAAASHALARRRDAATQEADGKAKVR